MRGERVNNQMNRRGITFQTPIHAGEHSWRGGGEGESLVITGEKYARYPFLFPDMSGYRVVRGGGGGEFVVRRIQVGA